MCVFSKFHSEIHSVFFFSCLFTPPPMEELISGSPRGLSSLASASPLPWGLFMASLCVSNCKKVHSAAEYVSKKEAGPWASPPWPRHEQDV